MDADEALQPSVCTKSNRKHLRLVHQSYMHHLVLHVPAEPLLIFSVTLVVLQKQGRKYESKCVKLKQINK